MVKLYIYLALSCVVFCFFGCQSKAPTTAQSQAQLQKSTPNIAYVMSTYDDAWNAVMYVIQYDLLLPIEIQDKTKGFFSTTMIKEYDQTPKRRFRITGDVSSDNQESMIKLHKVLQAQMANGTWKTFASDLMLEKHIVEKIYDRLQ